VTKRWKWLLAVLTAFALVAAACGDDDDGAAPTTTVSASDDGGDDGDGEEETTTTEAVELTASDIGVTAESITIAVLVSDLDGLRAAGMALPMALTTDHLATRWTSYFDEWNAAGGINGRMIEPLIVTWDPVRPDTMDDACSKITLDNEVFLALNANGFRPASIECVIDGGTFVFYGETVAQNLHDTGMFLSIAPPAETAAKTAVAFAIDNGDIAPGDKIGVLTGNGTGLAEGGAEVKALLEADGYEVQLVTANTLSGDTAAINQEAGASVDTFSAAGVKHVFNLLPFTQAQGFWASVGSTSLTFTVVDASSSNCTAFGASRTPPEAAGAACVTTWDGVANADGTLRADTEFEAECRAHWDEVFGDVFSAPSSPGVPSGQEVTDADGETLTSDFAPNECVIAWIVEQALRDAGPDLTHESFFDAAMAITEGPVALASNGEGGFAPGKTFFANFMQPVTLNIVTAEEPKDANGSYKGCPAPVTCWVPVSATWQSVE
jgi:hypothetical protein